jgi:sulfatase maturation enzyme AslB (radical SAM superfamily)
MVRLILKNHLTPGFVARMLAWHARYYVTGRGAPVSAGVYITNACNCRCVMCNIWRSAGEKAVYPFAEQKKAIDVLAKAGCYYYSVSGGEPTLVPDLCERLAYAAKRIPYVHMVTNGLTMDEALARALAGAGIQEVSVSIDGGEYWHNRLRGRADAFEKAWHALELLRTRARRVHLVVNSILSPHNLAGLRELDKLLGAFPGVRQKYLPLSLHELFGNKNAGGIGVDASAAASAEDIGRFIDAAGANPRVVNSRVFLRKAKQYFAGEADLLGRQKRCLYPCHAMEFDANGCAYPCMTGCGRGNGLAPQNDLAKYLRSPAYRQAQKALASCTKCRGVMPLCYYEPRLNFPFHYFVKELLYGRGPRKGRV